MSVAVKICGLSDREALHAAIEGGASYIGFNFIPSSKRYIAPAAARDLLATLPQPALCRFATTGEDIHDTEQLVLTALFLDPTDQEIIAAIEALRPFLGLIQLHGNETPARVTEIKKLTGLPIMKAIPIATAHDFNAVATYEKVADMLLFDTKVGAAPTGGTGQSFDWSLMTGRRFSKPWMLAGGLNSKNIKKAVQLSGAQIIDVSSGVETKGKKDPKKIKTLLDVSHDC